MIMYITGFRNRWPNLEVSEATGSARFGVGGEWCLLVAREHGARVRPPSRSTARAKAHCGDTLRLPLAFANAASGVNGLVNSPHADLLLPLASLGNVVRTLHPHERVHLHSESLLDAQRHISGETRVAVQKA
jgi:hypothetical protein